MVVSSPNPQLPLYVRKGVADHRLIIILGLLVMVLVAEVSRIPPRTGREWTWILVAVTFLFWLLAGFRSVRAW